MKLVCLWPLRLAEHIVEKWDMQSYRCGNHRRVWSLSIIRGNNQTTRATATETSPNSRKIALHVHFAAVFVKIVLTLGWLQNFLEQKMDCDEYMKTEWLKENIQIFQNLIKDLTKSAWRFHLGIKKFRLCNPSGHGGIVGLFWQTTSILAWARVAKILMVRPNKPDMLQQDTEIGTSRYRNIPR